MFSETKTIEKKQINVFCRVRMNKESHKMTI